MAFAVFWEKNKGEFMDVHPKRVAFLSYHQGRIDEGTKRKVKTSKPHPSVEAAKEQ